MDDEEVKETVEHPETANPSPEVTPPPVAKPEEAHDTVKEAVNALTERVSSLEEIIRGLTPSPRDTTPNKIPWTHRRFGG